MKTAPFSLTVKQKAELLFWKHEMKNYILWYKGDIPVLYNTLSPLEEEKIAVDDLINSAIFTWTELHQKPKYLKDLSISSEQFANLRVLDVGSGPIPSATCFANSEIYALDSLIDQYAAIGYPVKNYSNVHFLNASVEEIPVEDHFFDAIISVNAIDHVDDLQRASIELARVAKVECKFVMHVHYHKPTVWEPQEITDYLFSNLFNWVKDLKVAKRSQKSFSSSLPEGEQYVLWSNI